MCTIRYKGEVYTGEYEKYPCATMDYIIIRLDGFYDTCMVGRTLEDGEFLSQYHGMIALVDDLQIITLKSSISMENARKMVSSYLNAGARNEAAKRKRAESREPWRIFFGKKRK